MNYPMIKTVTILILIFTSYLTANGQMKIDSLGYHYGEEGYFIVEKQGLTAENFYNNLLDHINRTYENPDNVIQAKTQNEYIRFNFIEYYMAEFRRSGIIDINIGGEVRVEVDFKDNRYRISMTPLDLYVLAHDIPNRLSFTIIGGGMANSLYNPNLKPKKEMVKGEVKKKLESYFNRITESLIDGISNAEEQSDDW